MYNVRSGDSLAKNPGTIIVRRLVRICVFWKIRYPMALSWGFQILSGGAVR